MAFLPNGTYTLAANGRGTITFATASRTYNLVFYLGPVGTNTTAVIQEDDPGISSDGNFTVQQSAAFTLASVQGNYALATSWHGRGFPANHVGTDRSEWHRVGYSGKYRHQYCGNTCAGAGCDRFLRLSRGNWSHDARAYRRNTKLCRVCRKSHAGLCSGDPTGATRRRGATPPVLRSFSVKLQEHDTSSSCGRRRPNA